MGNGQAVDAALQVYAIEHLARKGVKEKERSSISARHDHALSIPIEDGVDKWGEAQVWGQYECGYERELPGIGGIQDRDGRKLALRRIAQIDNRQAPLLAVIEERYASGSVASSYARYQLSRSSVEGID
jgi:hypothetical protein